METRGTGTSEKPNHGYRMARIAKDVYDMLISLKIEKAYFMGHSMGANVILSFIDLFGQNMIKKFILVDQPPWLWSDLNESDESMILQEVVEVNLMDLKNDLIYIGKKAKKFLILKIISQLA